ncbi:MAG: hypothetical protein ACETWK_14130 [Candidatus Aminicenantaceae bacterium]
MCVKNCLKVERAWFWDQALLRKDAQSIKSIPLLTLMTILIPCSLGKSCVFLNPLPKLSFTRPYSPHTPLACFIFNEQANKSLLNSYIIVEINLDGKMAYGSILYNYCKDIISPGKDVSFSEYFTVK